MRPKRPRRSNSNYITYISQQYIHSTYRSCWCLPIAIITLHSLETTVKKRVCACMLAKCDVCTAPCPLVCAVWPVQPELLLKFLGKFRVSSANTTLKNPDPRNFRTLDYHKLLGKEFPNSRRCSFAIVPKENRYRTVSYVLLSVTSTALVHCTLSA